MRQAVARNRGKAVARNRGTAGNRGAAVARNGIAVALAVAIASGYLLASGALDPVLGKAVALALGRDPDPTATLNAAKVTDWMYFDDRPEWSSLREVPTPPDQPDPPVPPTRPQVAPPENPHHWQFSGPAPMPHYSLKPMDSCFQPRGPGENVAQLTATAGTKSATVSWWDLGDPDTRSYQLAIVRVGPSTNPTGSPATPPEPVRFVNVAPP